jgi:hypothetical protein
MVVKRHDVGRRVTTLRERLIAASAGGPDVREPAPRPGGGASGSR